MYDFKFITLKIDSKLSYIGYIIDLLMPLNMSLKFFMYAMKATSLTTTAQIRSLKLSEHHLPN